MNVITAAGMGEIYGTYVDDECFDIHDYDADTDHDTDDTGDDTEDDTNDDTDGDTDDGGRGNLYRIKAQGSRTSNEHPRRAMDVILRQSKALIEIFNSRWVPWLNSWSQ